MAQKKRCVRASERKLVDAFGRWLVVRQGLSEATRRLYSDVARRFVGALGSAPSRFRAADVPAFILRETRGLGRSGVRLRASEIVGVRMDGIVLEPTPASD